MEASFPSPLAAAASMPLTEIPDDATRLRLELEFVQLLANAKYLQHLAVNKYLDDPAFLGFLTYLKYWKEPDYVKFISFPYCLVHLDLLTSNAEFRQSLKNPDFVQLVHQQQGFQWVAGLEASGLRQLQDPPVV